MPSCVLWSSLSAVLMNHFNDRYFFPHLIRWCDLYEDFSAIWRKFFLPEIILFPFPVAHILFLRQFMWRLTVFT